MKSIRFIWNMNRCRHFWSWLDYCMMTEGSEFDSRQRQRFSLLHSFQSDSEVLPAPYEMKWLGHENNPSSFLSHSCLAASWYYQSSIYSPTDAPVSCLKNNIKIYIKITLKQLRHVWVLQLHHHQGVFDTLLFITDQIYSATPPLY